jgi:hypothetical protein
MSKQIRVGQIWRRVNGKPTEIVGKATEEGYAWVDCYGNDYTSTGRYYIDGDDGHDLDTLIYDPHGQPAETELERKAWDIYLQGGMAEGLQGAFELAAQFLAYRDTLRNA